MSGNNSAEKSSKNKDAKKSLDAFLQMLVSDGVSLKTEKELMAMFSIGMIRKSDGTRFNSNDSFGDVLLYINKKEKLFEKAAEADEEIQKGKTFSSKELFGEDTKETDKHFIHEPYLMAIMDAIKGGAYDDYKGTEDYKKLKDLCQTLSDRLSNIKRGEIMDEPGASELYNINQGILLFDEEYEMLKTVGSKMLKGAKNNTLLLCNKDEIRGISFSGLNDQNANKREAKINRGSIGPDAGRAILQEEIHAEVNSLLKELNDTDSGILQMNSKEFKAFQKTLTALEKKLANGSLSINEMQDLFEQKGIDGSEANKELSVMDAARAYFNVKQAAGAGKLSDTQAKRVYIYHKLECLNETIDSIHDSNRENRREFLYNKIANKCVLAYKEIKGDSQFKRLLVSEGGYKRTYNHFAIDKTSEFILKNKSLKRLYTISKKSPIEVMERVYPKELGNKLKKASKNTVSTAEKNLKILAESGMDPNVPAIYQFLLKRTSQMLSEFSGYKITHSNQYSNLKTAINTAREVIIRNAANSDTMKIEALSDALTPLAKAAKAFENKHINDDILTHGAGGIKRSGIARELCLISDFVKGSLEAEHTPQIKEMMKLLYVHHRELNDVLSERQTLPQDRTSEECRKFVEKYNKLIAKGLDNSIEIGYSHYADGLETILSSKYKNELGPDAKTEDVVKAVLSNKAVSEVVSERNAEASSVGKGAAEHKTEIEKTKVSMI